MLKRCALLIDGEGALAESLRGWLETHGLAVEVRAKWSHELCEQLDPAIIFVAVDLPEKAGFAHCRRARERAPAVPLVLTTATIPPDELELNRQAESAGACLDKRTLTREEVMAKVEALLGPLPERSDSAAAAREVGEVDAEAAAGGADVGPAPGRVTELEEEVRRLRWELEATRHAAQDGDFLRLSSVVASKEKEIARLKKEITARERELVTGRRTLREALSEAAAAKREREQVAGHFGRLNRDLKDGQAEITRLRVEVQRRATEAEQAIADWEAERRRHADNRRLHEATLAAHADTLQEVKLDQQAARSALEKQLRADTSKAVAARSKKWRARFERLSRAHERLRAITNDQLSEQQAAHQSELERRDSDHRAVLDRVAEEMAAESQRGLEELRREHTESLRALRQDFDEQLTVLQATEEQERAKGSSARESALSRAAEELATARAQAAQHEGQVREAHERELADLKLRHAEAATALEARMRGEREQALATAAGDWERCLEGLQRQYASSLGTLRQEYADRLETVSSVMERGRVRREAEHSAARHHDAEELLAASTRAARLEQEALERHEAELTRVEAGHAEAQAELEARLNQERDEAVAATVAAWQVTLEEQRREHEQQIAALRAGHGQKLADTDAEHRAALARAARELASLRADGEQQREELRQRHERALEEVRAVRAAAEKQAEETHRSAQLALESRLRGEQATAVAVTVTEWEGKLEKLRRGHAAALEALRRESQSFSEAQQTAAAKQLAERDAERQGALQRAGEALAAARTEAARLDQQTREDYQRERGRAESEYRESLASLERKLHSEHEETATATVKAWEQKVEKLRRGHAASLQALRREHDEQAASLQALGEMNLAARNAEHAAELRRLREELAVAHGRVAQFEAAPVLSPQQHAAALEELESRLRAEHEGAIAAVVAEWKAKMDRLRRGHADTVAALRREHHDQLDAVQAARQRSAAAAHPDQREKVVSIKAATGDRSG